MNGTHNPSGHIRKTLAIIGASVALSTLPGCTVFPERVDAVISVSSQKKQTRAAYSKHQGGLQWKHA